ncbi:hypothetical protein GL263_22375 [Streptomyces durbertensis]|uniref:Lipoprotein n=1 Tax=Streptomyces durbertensis TaxID=2448886 RepID=A0ABR6ELQ1_9ACTN|nr:hypothetical protein [Streptomyces durbertensis]MBB1246280.1 hypothetical protein [Streptomyces durbertensis]
MSRSSSPVVRASAVVVAALLVFLGGSGCSPGEGGGQRTERQVVEAYVEALNARDSAALVALAGQGRRGVEEDARGLIADGGGRSLVVRDVRVLRDFGPDLASAHVVAVDEAGEKFETYVQLARERGTWVLVLGKGEGFPEGGKETASVTRPE